MLILAIWEAKRNINYERMTCIRHNAIYNITGRHVAILSCLLVFLALHVVGAISLSLI